MAQQPVSPSSDVSGEDRLWVLLCFLLTPLMPIITLLMEDKKSRPFIKYHTIPTLALGIAEWVFIAILAIIPFVGCIGPFIYIINLIYGLKANKGEYTEIPFISNFVKKQGWG